ncbi:MAG: DUF364 domain-containing protein [Bacillota bacterium]|nr:DUF364 domain-containing protein [Bacillota bacterium]
MWALYDELIAGLPGGVYVRQAGQSPWRAWVETEHSLGLASLLLPGREAAPARLLAEFAGQPLAEVAALAKSWLPVPAAVGVAALNAWYNQPLLLQGRKADVYPPGISAQAGQDEGDIFLQLLPKARGQRVATVGHFPGIREIYADCCDFYVLEQEPRPGDLPAAAAEYLLPAMDLVFITGMTLTNKTLPRLLQLCAKAFVVLVGPSVPLTPLLFNYGVDMLSGTLITDPAACIAALLRGTADSDYFRCAAKALLRAEPG